MGAGGSASVEAERSRQRIAIYERRIEEERARYERWALAGQTEARVAWRLTALDGLGWSLLPDRRWPGTRSANIDLLAAGPGGVLVIDVKAWGDVRVEDGRLFRGDEDAQDALDAIADVAALVEEATAVVGLAPLEVVPLLVFAGHKGLRAQLGRVQVLGEHDLTEFCLRRGRRLEQAQVTEVVAVLERDFPPYDAQPALFSPVVSEPVLPAEPPTLFDVDELVAADLAAALAEPVETWMTWLHPDQARLVRRSWNGPARFTGPAGTGKTVVGLHRVAYLARTRPGRLLWVTYVKTLPRTMRACYERLAPDTADRVEFTNLHAWAADLLRTRGVACHLDAGAARESFERAWERVGRDGPLTRLNVPESYWREEIDWVVKGRDLSDFPQYRDLPRLGRRARLRVEHREALWTLYEEYQKELRQRDRHDFNDVLTLALAEVRREPLSPGYAAVVVDEVQDLTCVGVQLLHAVAGDRPDSLVLIGDGTQAVYPGGFTLAEAGVGVSGRAVRLEVNYRNTAEIMSVATRVGARAAYDDSEGTGRKVPAARVLRSGGHVVRCEAVSGRAHDEALLAALRAALRRPDVGGGDVALLAMSRDAVARYLRLLRDHDIAAVDLAEHQGRPDGCVKVGTVKRAKGLEFKYVFLPMLDAGEIRRRPREGDAAYRERCELAARQMYVGITRARDGVWLGSVVAEDRATA